MPLAKGTSREVIGNNIREMDASGHPHNVAVAAALRTAHPEGGRKVKKPASPMARKLAAAHMGGAKKSAAARGAAKSPRPNANAPVGLGGRFAALKQKLASRPGIRKPGAVAGEIGREKYGNAAMTR